MDTELSLSVCSWSVVYSFESFDLCDQPYRGDIYRLAGFVEPEPQSRESYDPAQDADNYGVTVFQLGQGPLEENVQIARMDTRHGGPHLDRVYLPPDVEDDKKKVDLGEDYSYARMRKYFETHWQYYADEHIRYNE